MAPSAWHCLCKSQSEQEAYGLYDGQVMDPLWREGTLDLYGYEEITSREEVMTYSYEVYDLPYKNSKSNYSKNLGEITTTHSIILTNWLNNFNI